MTTATLWISGKVCRVIVRVDASVVDMNDDWNNVASAQSWAYDAYPDAIQKTIRDSSRIPELDAEWNRCKLGVG
jgi:hypothetical protein